MLGEKTTVAGWFILIGMPIYLFAAVYSTGYFHPDEHYQIIEFANFKLGKTPYNDLAWEYGEQIRPSFQVWLVYLFFKFMGLFNIEDPYMITSVLRMVTGVFALAVTYLFVITSMKRISVPFRKVYVCISLLLWFVPFLSVRFSSENISGLFFVSSIALFQYERATKSLKYVFIGILQGLAFICRFQCLVMSAGFFIWLLFVHRAGVRQLLFLITGGVSVLLLGIILDLWFYGETVFTFYNYFNTNILQDVASDFGTRPWYFYLQEIALQPFFLIGSLILLSLAGIFLKDRKNLLLYCTVPFLIVHSIIPHKELRFIFPLIPFVPIVITKLFEITWSIPVINKFLADKRYLWLGPAIVLIIINLLLLTCVSVRSAGNSSKQITEFIHNNYYGKPVILYTQMGTNPYTPYLGLKEDFYIEKNIRFKYLDEMEGDSTGRGGKNIILLCLQPDELPKEIRKSNSIYQLELISIPEWMNKGELFFFNRKQKAYILYRKR